MTVNLTSFLNNIVSLQNKPKENDNKQLFSLQEENVGLKKKIPTLEHELQSAHKLHHSTKNQLEGELLDLKKKLRDTEAKYSNLAATPPKVSLYTEARDVNVSFSIERLRIYTLQSWTKWMKN